MSAVAPAMESTELVNRLLNLSYEDDQEQIGQIKWRLDALVRRDKADAIAIFGCGLSALMAKNKADAESAFERLRGRHQGLDTTMFINFANLAMNLGHYGAVRDFISARFARGDDAPWEVRAALVHSALASGNVDWLTNGSVILKDEYETITVWLERNGLRELFPGHQQVVSSIISPHQCAVSASYSQDDGGQTLFMSYFVPKPRAERRLLSDRIDEALGNFYLDHGMRPNCYFGVISVVIEDSTSPVSL